MNPKLHRTFPSREHFAEHFVRRLSDRGIEFKLAGQEAPPTGTVLQLDLRLEDGRPLIVGTGEVTSGGNGAGTFRVRFLELAEESRSALDELVVLAAATSDQTPATATGTGIRDLVQGVYGDPESSAPVESGAVLVPPDPGSGETPATGPDRASKTNGPRSLLQRLQISPGVVVIAIIAGATGAAANAWFHDLANLFFELSESEIEAAPVIDQLPTDVTPSDFSAETEEGSAVVDQAPPDEPAQQQSETVPILSGSVAAEDVGGSEGSPGQQTAPLGGTPADRIRMITWDEYASETVVTFFGNGAFLPERVLRRRVAGGRPRELIKLRGIDLPFRETLIPTETPELVRIRTGFHPQDRINELHVVLDLTGSDVHLDRMERDGNNLSLHLTSAPEPPDGETTPASTAE